MTWRRGAYVISGIAAAGLIAELAWWAYDRVHLHAVDNGIRFLDSLRERARM